jgi:4-hydroxy-3-methylbut-2-enyl diphosphate reductase
MSELLSMRRRTLALGSVCAVATAVSSWPVRASTPRDTLVMASAFDDIISLDPAEAFELSAGELMGNGYERLLRYDVNDPSKLVPDLAREWSLSADGRTYSFTLKPGLRFASGNPLTAEDVVIIPAFGTTLDMERRLRDKGIPVERYDTTCPFVEKVWNRSEQIARKGYTVVVHGKPSHEETRATFSHSAAHAPTIVVTDMEEARLLADFIRGQRSEEEFKTIFKDRCSEGFDMSGDLQRIGVVNQTTMLAGDTQAIADYLKDVIKDLFGPDPEKVSEHFADTRDTLCYATMDNQTAVTGMLETEADLAFVVGGRNSSNTSHLVELCEQRLPTFFIRSEADILPDGSILHTDWRTQQEHHLEKFLPTDRTPIRILVTSGASCPDSIVEQVICRLVDSVPGTRPFADILAEWV